MDTPSFRPVVAARRNVGAGFVCSAALQAYSPTRYSVYCAPDPARKQRKSLAVAVTSKLTHTSLE